jgi:DNA-binding NarL/FixJ family response regulator
VTEHVEPGRPDAIRVMLVDDHALFRRGLKVTLELEPDMEVVGESGDGADAVTKAVETLPDLVLMDVRMPRRGGIEACSAIRPRCRRRRSSC